MAYEPVIYSLRARTEGEALAHLVIRRTFLHHVVADARTRRLFELWGQQTGIDNVIAHMRELLDAAATRAGLPNRAQLRERAHAIHLIPVLDALQQDEGQYERILADTQAARMRQALGFVVAELYGTVVDEEVPIRGWLASDLMDIFRWEIAAQVYGEHVALTVPRSPTVGQIPKGQRPKRDGHHLEHYATWYYRARIALPRWTIARLAEEYREQEAAAGIGARKLIKDERGFDLRADTSLIRHGVREAQRLLELTVPPEQWADFLSESGVIVGEKLVH